MSKQDKFTESTRIPIESLELIKDLSRKPVKHHIQNKGLFIAVAVKRYEKAWLEVLKKSEKEIKKFRDTDIHILHLMEERGAIDPESRNWEKK